MVCLLLIVITEIVIIGNHDYEERTNLRQHRSKSDTPTGLLQTEITILNISSITRNIQPGSCKTYSETLQAGIGFFDEKFKKHSKNPQLLK